MIKKIVFGFLFSLFYLSGLISLFSFIITLNFKKSMIFTPNYFLISAALFLFVAFVGGLWNEGSLSKTLKTYSLLTLVPGIIGFFVIFFGENIFYETLLMNTNLDINIINTLMKTYMERAVPSTYGLIAFYIVVGAVMFWFSRKAK